MLQLVDLQLDANFNLILSSYVWSHFLLLCFLALEYLYGSLKSSETGGLLALGEQAPGTAADFFPQASSHPLKPQRMT